MCPYTKQIQFERFDGTRWLYLGYGIVSSLHPPDKNNTITAEVNGNSFTFYVNGTPVHAAFKDTTSKPLTLGDVGLVVEDLNADVAFSHMTITQLP